MYWTHSHLFCGGCYTVKGSGTKAVQANNKNSEQIAAAMRRRLWLSVTVIVKVDLYSASLVERWNPHVVCSVR